jgi:hypothetical protein
VLGGGFIAAALSAYETGEISRTTAAAATPA